MDDLSGIPEISKRFAVASLPNERSFRIFREISPGILQDSNGSHWSAHTFGEKQNQVNSHPLTPEEYLGRLHELIREMRAGKVDKVVFSRFKEELFPVVEPLNFLRRLLNRLREAYPSAFVYAHTDETGKLWIGASPEILITASGGVFSTVALAGTRVATGNDAVWGQKEIMEQAIVADYIQKTLTGRNAAIVRTEGPYTSAAGHLEHIRTDFHFRSGLTAADWAGKLHPTPAIAGLPLENALELIRQKEGYDREYYAGWLGWQNGAEACYFVHLRCVRIDFEQNRIRYYAGGGIMPDSDPDSEWKETENKMDIMKEVITKLLSEMTK